jgi:fumarate hydratase subunit beta
LSREMHLTLPLSEEQARNMQVGDIVYLSGTIYTMRDMGYRRAVDLLKSGEKLPFDVSQGAIWHCGPIARQKENGTWEIVAAGSTTSSRFSQLGAEIIRRLGLRCTVGKGTMGKEAVDAMESVGSFFLNTTGGCAALYARQIETVSEVHWLDLGMPEAVWVMKVKGLGPLIVGIDAHGESLFQNIGQEMKKLLFEQYQNSNLDISHNFAYLPKRVPGKAVK